MINFDFENDFPEDYFVRLNPRAINDFLPHKSTLEEDFDLISKAYLHAGDVIFKEYYPNLKKIPNDYEIGMGGVIFRLYMHAIETKLKSLITVYNSNIKGHNLSELLNELDKYYIYKEIDDTKYKDFIKKFSEFSNGSETGRYPVDKYGNTLAETVDGAVEFNGIVKVIENIHNLFLDYFNNLIKKQ